MYDGPNIEAETGLPGVILSSQVPIVCLLLKNIMRHPYLKILDLANLFVADAPMKKKSKIILLPSHSTLKYGSEYRPCMKFIKIAYDICIM